MKMRYSAFKASLYTILVCALVTVTSSTFSDDVDVSSLPRSLKFIGIGYNVLTGNPDGDEGVDHGLLMTRRILQLTYTNGGNPMPDQVTMVSRDNCMTVAPNHVFYGTKSYQELLCEDVELKGDIGDIFSGYEFSMSRRYQQVRDDTKSGHRVYTENRYVCSRGHARYKDELARVDRYPLSRSFVVDACALPTSFSLPEYMAFLEEWGTAVVIEVEVGKKIIDRFLSTDAEFVQYVREHHADMLRSGGRYMDHSSSVIVDMDALTEAVTGSEIFGRYSETIGLGSDEQPEPVAIKVIGINELFREDFWQRSNAYVTDGLCQADFISRMSDVAQNVKLALESYAAWKGAEISTDNALQVPVTWPYGTYSLPMPQVGCPTTHFYWKTGSRYQDTEDYFPNNYWSDPCHLEGPYYIFGVQQNFCSKTNAAEDDYGWTWPQGAYCVFKKGDSCPSGDFEEGWVLWDDSDTLNSNRLTGEVPEGVYDRDTLIDFCCREDGSVNDAITLPTDDNFFLFRKSSSGCQQVEGMSVNDEYFRWDGEDDRIVFREYVGGSTPYNTGQDSDHLLHYCYYYTGNME